jgi:hypothetical protein
LIMDETSFRILDVLSQQIGKPISINELKNKIGKSYGSAYYSNIHSKLRSLTREHITNEERYGKSSIATLNFSNWFTNDLLEETDIWKKQMVLRKHPELQMLLSDIHRSLSELNFTKSMSIVNSENNLKLNKAEFLILLNIPKKDRTLEDVTIIYKKMKALQSLHNIRSNTLILTTDEFIQLLKSREANPLREMLANRINFISPQAFWNEITIASEEKGLRIKFEENETNPEKISENALVYNLNRFGYREFGPELLLCEDICIEYVITSVLLKGDERRIGAIPIILGKKETNYSLLIFLSRKYDCSSKLLGLLIALEKNKSTGPLKDAIQILESIGTKVTVADEESIKENLILYSVA